jgi:hypothetical protein
VVWYGGAARVNAEGECFLLLLEDEMDELIFAGLNPSCSLGISTAAGHRRQHIENIRVSLPGRSVLLLPLSKLPNIMHFPNVRT